MFPFLLSEELKATFPNWEAVDGHWTLDSAYKMCTLPYTLLLGGQPQLLPTARLGLLCSLPDGSPAKCERQLKVCTQQCAKCVQQLKMCTAAAHWPR